MRIAAVEKSSILIADFFLFPSVCGTILGFLLPIVIRRDLNLIALFSYMPVLGCGALDLSFDFERVLLLLLGNILVVQLRRVDIVRVVRLLTFELVERPAVTVAFKLFKRGDLARIVALRQPRWLLQGALVPTTTRLALGLALSN